MVRRKNFRCASSISPYASATEIRRNDATTEKSKKLERPAGLGPASQAWEAWVIPLYEGRVKKIVFLVYYQIQQSVHPAKKFIKLLVSHFVLCVFLKLAHLKTLVFHAELDQSIKFQVVRLRLLRRDP